MSRNPQGSIESRSYSLHFFLLSGILAACTAWAIWDEVEARRPWKKYQREFNRIEQAVVERQLAEAEEKLIAEKATLVGAAHTPPATVEELGERIEVELRELSRNERYRALTARAADLERSIQKGEERMRFAKSEAEEDFYRWKHALREGDDYERYKRIWLGNTAAVADIQPELGRLRAERDQIKEEIARLEARIGELRGARDELTAYRDALRQRLGKVHERPPTIQQVVLPAYDRNNFGEPQDRVDRCTSCHVGIDREPPEEGVPRVFAPHPRRETLLGKHPVDRIGCTPCHGGQGAAVASAKQAHGYEYSHGPSAGNGVRLREPLEHWDEPMFEGDFVESSCPRCHQTFVVPGASTLNEAKLLFTELGCHGCHLTEGFEEKAKIGPDLTRIGAKVFPEWLVNWIEDPKRYLPKTRMPDYRLSREQVLSIAAYLLRNSESYRFARGYEPQGSPEQGKTLVDSLGCLACHSLGKNTTGGYLAPIGYDLVPNLSGVASKVGGPWLFNWLKDPKGFRRTTKMPDLRLSDEEARNVTAYLLTLGEPPGEDRRLRDLLADEERAERGRKLIYDFGCYSCHEIRRFQEASRIAPPLTEFGAKDPEVELYFGDALARDGYRLEFGQELESWENWTFNKLKNPPIYADEVAESRMPDFGLSDENASTLLVLLRSFTGTIAPEEYRRGLSEGETAIEKGKNLVRTLNCVGCHEIDGRGGDVRKYYADPAMAPPVLTGEGDKVQAGWLFRFLKKPMPLRPWLTVRMPTFGLADDDASALAQYFNALSVNKIPFAFFDAKQVSAASKAEGARLFGIRGASDYEHSLKCDSCHPRGAVLPEGNPANWGPDLSLASQRLKPEWIAEWLRNPQALQPGTRMPNFFYDYDTYEGEVEITELMDAAEDKIVALRDFLMTMEQ